MPLPTYVIAGAQKCGTSSLAASLRQHPQVFMARPKELHFFDHHIRRGLDWYADQFTPTATQTQLGEATPTYLFHPPTRRRMLAMLPDAKYVVTLRNPVERAYSHYWHSHRLGHETVTFAEAIDLEKERITTGVRRERHRYSYVARGRYLRQLKAIVAATSREQLHVLLLEDLADDRVASLQRLCDFLGIDREPVASIKEKWANRYRISDEESGQVKPAAYPPMNPEMRALLVERFRDRNDRLGEWLGRDLSAWNKI